MDTFEDTLSLSALLGDVSEENTEVCTLPSMDFELPITTQKVPDQTVLLPNASYQGSHSSDCKTVIATNNTSNLGTGLDSFANGRHHGSSSISSSVSSITTSLTYSLSLPSNSNCTVSNSVSTTCSVLQPNFSVSQITASTRSLQCNNFANNSKDTNISSDVLCHNGNSLFDSDVALLNGSHHSTTLSSHTNGTITDGIALSNDTSHATQNGNLDGQHHEHATLPAKSRLRSPISSDSSDHACQGCFILHKKLNNSKQWNKFLHQKLMNFDKLLHVVQELEREQQRHLDLQLAYDNRTREWRNQQDQLVHLLQEANPLRERLAEVEGQFLAVNKQLKDCLMAKHALELSSHQMRAKIEDLTQQVNPMHQEMTEKKLLKKMADNKRLRLELETKNCEIHNLSEHISSHRLYFERQGKKSLWALRLAARLAEASTAEGCLDEETKCRLHSALKDTESTLDSQFRGFRRLAEGRLQGNIIELNGLPTMDKWLDDFDREGPSAWDEQLVMKAEAGSRRRSVKQENGIAVEDASAMALSNRRRGKGAPTTKIEEQTSKEWLEDDAASRSKSDVEDNQESRERKRRGPYRKKSREEKLAIKREGALIEKMFMNDAMEPNNDALIDDNTIDEKRSPNRKYTKFVTGKGTLGSSSGLSNRTKIRTQSADNVQAKNTYDDDSDSTSDFIDCGPPAVKDESYTRPVKKSFMSSSQRFSPRLSTSRTSITDSSPATVVAARTPVARAATEEQENHAPSESFLFGTDSDSDAESNNTPVKKALSIQNAAGQKLPSSRSLGSDLTSRASLPTRTAPQLSQCDAKEPVHRAGDTIHGRAKVSRVFDRGVVSSCSQRNTTRNYPVTLVKLGGTSKVPPKVHNVKELTQLMKESLKEKQRLLSLPKVKFTDKVLISKPLIEKATALTMNPPVIATPSTKSIKPLKQISGQGISKQMHNSSYSSDGSSDECAVETDQAEQNQSLTKIIPDTLNKEKVANNSQALVSNTAVSSKNQHPSENEPLQEKIVSTRVSPKQSRDDKQEAPELTILKDDLAMSSSNSDDDDLGSAAESDAAVPRKARVSKITRRRNKPRPSAKLMLSDVDLSDASPERAAVCSSGSNNKRRLLGAVDLPGAYSERPASSTPIRGRMDRSPTPSREMVKFGSIFDSNDEDSCNVSGRPSSASPRKMGSAVNPPLSPSKRITENEHVDNSFGLDLSLTTDDDASFSHACNEPSTICMEALKNQTHSRTSDTDAKAVNQGSKSNVCETSTGEENVSDVLKYDGPSKPDDDVDVIYKRNTDCPNADQSFETTEEEGPSNAVSVTESSHLVVKIFNEEVCSKKTERETETTNSTRDSESSLMRTRSRSRSTSKTCDTSSTAGDRDTSRPAERGRKRGAASNSGGQQTLLKEPLAKRTLRNSARKDLNKSDNEQINLSKANASVQKSVHNRSISSVSSVDENDNGKENDDDDDGKVFRKIFAELIKSSALLEDDYSDSLSTLVLSPFITLTPQRHCSKDSSNKLSNDLLDSSLSTDKDESFPSLSEGVSERRSRPVTRPSNYQLNFSHVPKMPITPSNKRGRRSASVTSSKPSSRSTRVITVPTTDSDQLERDIHDSNVSEHSKSFHKVVTVCNLLDSVSENIKDPGDLEKNMYTGDKLETKKEEIPKSSLVSSTASQPEGTLATVHRTSSNAEYVAKPNLIKKTLSAKNGCSIIPRQASATAGFDPTCRVMRRRRNIGMKYTKTGSTEGDCTPLLSLPPSVRIAREVIPSTGSPLQSNTENVIESNPPAPKADTVGRKCKLPPTTVKHETRQKTGNAKLASDLSQPASNDTIHSENNSVVCNDSALQAPIDSSSTKQRFKAKLKPVYSASPVFEVVVTPKPIIETNSVKSLEAPGQKDPSSLTKVAVTPNPNIKKPPVSVTSWEASDQKAPSLTVRVNEKRVNNKSNRKTNETTSLVEGEQHCESGNEVVVQCLEMADATSWNPVLDTQHSPSAKKDVITDVYVSIIHEQDSDGSECELIIDVGDNQLDLTRSDDLKSTSLETSNVLEERGITDVSAKLLKDAKETSMVTPITKDEELFGHLSSSSDEDDELANTLLISAEETSTKSELKEKMLKIPTKRTEMKTNLVTGNTSKMKITKLKGTILDDIITLGTTDFTVTPKAACRPSNTKSFVSENQIRELERRKSMSNPLLPTKSAATVTLVANRLLPLKPTLSLQQRKLKNLLAQRRMSQSSNRKQSGTVARRSLPVLTKTQNLQCSSSQSSLTSSPAVSETESSDEPIRRRTPGKRPRIICSDSDSDSQEPQKVSRLKTTTEKRDTSNISCKLLESGSAKKTFLKPAQKRTTDVQSLIERISEKFAPKHKTAILLETKIKSKLPPPSSGTIKKTVQDTPSVEYSVPAEALRVPATLPQCLIDTDATNIISPLTVGDGKLNTRKDILSVVKGISVPVVSTLEASCFNSQKVVSRPAKCSLNDDESSEDEMLQINISAGDQTDDDDVDDELEINTSKMLDHNSTYFKRKADSNSVLSNNIKKAKLSASDLGESTSPQHQFSQHSDILTSAVEQLKPISFFGTDILFKEEQVTQEQNTAADEPPTKQTDTLSQTSSSCVGPNHAELLTFSSINLPEILPAKEQFLQEAQTEYTSIIDGLMTSKMGGGDWRKGVDKLLQTLHMRIDSDRTLSLMSHLKPLSNALIHHIIRTDPLQDLPSSANVLCPDLYKLFMFMKVVEENLSVVADHPLEELVTTTCHSIVSSSGFPDCSVSLSPGCLASLAAWHTASCCAVRKHGREPQWERARCFLVTLLCRHPGSAHAALLASLSLGRFVFLRMVHYRPSSGLERAIMWALHHGAWIGRDAVRKSLLNNMSGRYAIEKPSVEPLLLVQSILNDLLHKVDKKTKVPYDTPQHTKTTVLGIDVLACWMGKSWVLEELLPFIIRFISSKKNVPSARLVLLIKEITESVLLRVGASQTDLAKLLGSLLNSEEPIAPVKYKDPKIHHNKQLMSTLGDVVADVVRSLLTAEDDS